VAIVFKNNASTTLSAALSSSATSITVADATKLPSITGDEYFFCSIDDGSNIEIVKVTGVSSNTLTIVRAQDNTTAQTFSSGDIIEQRLTAAVLETFPQLDADEITATEFIGDLRGAVIFKAKAGEAIDKGEVVYVSGISGNTPVVALADADDSSKMPAFGLVLTAASLNGSTEVVTFGTISGVDTSAFSVGDTLYVSTTAGELTNSKPAGEASLLQNMGKVQRSHASSGSIKVGGAGRTNDTPNLNDGNIFIGNASNQATTSTLDTSIVPENTNLYYTDARVQAVSINNVVEDTTPQLGGDLASNGNDILFADSDQAMFGLGNDLRIFHNGTTSKIQNHTGHFDIQNLADGQDIRFGSDDGAGGVANYFRLDGGEQISVASKNIRFEDGIKSTYGNSDDLEIYHNGSGSYIDDAGTGPLVIRSNEIQLQKYTGETMASFIADSTVQLRYDNVTKLATSSTGVDVTGVLIVDTTINVNDASGYGNIELGGASGGYVDFKTPFNDDHDARIFYGGTNLQITTNIDNPILLKHNNSTVLTTSSSGIDVTGVITTDGLTTSADINFGDNDKAKFGTDSDLQIYHDGNNSVIDDTGTGNLYIRGTNINIQNLDADPDENMITAVANGAVTLYHNSEAKLATSSAGITVNGTVTGTIATAAQPNITSVGTLTGLTTTGDINFGDSDKAIFGAGSDLQIYHDGNNSFIDELGTGILYIRAASDLRLTNADTSKLYANFEDGGASKLYHDGDLKLATASTGVEIKEALTVGSSANDLGTTAGNQLTPLTLRSDTANTDSLLFTTERLADGTDWTTAAHRIQRKVDATKMGYVQFGNQNGDLITFGKNNSEYGRFSGSGDFGVGTSNPAYKLHVSGGAGDGIYVDGTQNTSIFLDSNNNTTGPFTIRVDSDVFHIKNQSTSGFNTGGSFLKYTDGGSLQFLGDGLVVTSSDEVAIGHTDPDTKLHIKGGGVTGGIFVEDSSDSSVSPVIKVQGNRQDTNESQSFTGGLALSSLQTNALANDGKHIGTIYFGANHTDGTAANIAYSASIAAKLSGAANSATDMPTDLVFYTGSTGRALGTSNQTYGDEAVRITAGGSFGIGTASPNREIDLTADNPRFQFTDSGLSNCKAEISGNSGHLALQADVGNSQGGSRITFDIDGGEVGRFTDSGLGVSATSLNANVHIGSANATGNATNPALQIGGTTTYRLGLYTQAERGVIDCPNGDDGLDFRVKTAGLAMRALATTGGILVKGTSAFGTGAGTANDITVGMTGTNTTGIKFDTASTAVSGNDRVYLVENKAGDRLAVSTAAGTEILSMLHEGRVGIGQTAPNAPLEIVSNITFANSDTFPQLLIRTASGASGNQLGFGVDEADNLAFIDAINRGNNVIPLVLQRYGGRVGIGVEAPTATLDVNGTIKLDGNYPTGTSNVALGDTALDSLTSGAYNVAIGNNALTANTEGAANTAIGNVALQNNTTGQYNSALGSGALLTNTTGSNNVAVGLNALVLNTIGGSNTALGRNALVANTTASNNVALGDSALAANTIGTGNVAVGVEGLTSNIVGSQNTTVGHKSLNNNTATGNTAIGYFAGRFNTTGVENSAIGRYSLYSNTTGSYNTAVGNLALQTGTITNCVAVGTESQRYATGTRNVSLGNETLRVCTGDDNTAIGHYSMDAAGCSGSDNTAVGSHALGKLTTAIYNTAVGQNALTSNTTGGSNCGIGSRALEDCTAGLNTAVGDACLFNVTTGASNTGIGQCGLGLTTGSNNTVLGSNAGNHITTGSNNLCVGRGAGTDSLANITTGSNNIILGNNAITNFEAKVALTVGSDERDKTDITNLPDNAGLNFVKQMRPVTYVWDNRDNYYPNTHEKYGERDHSKKSSDKQLGFLAQEIKAIENSIGWTDDHIVNTSNTNSLKLTETQLIPILVKALQEADAKIEALTTRIETLEG